MAHLRWIGFAGALTVALLVAAPLAATPGAIPGGNLVQNPGAEDSPGSDVPTVVKPVGWATTGKFSTWAYPAAEGDWPTRAFAATIGGGKNFFAGGPGDNSGKQTTHTASQTIDVSGAATEVDAGQVGATLTAFIGGYTAAEDLATVTARFLSAAGAQLASVRVGPVTRDDRKLKTVLLKRIAQANIPPNTRSIARRDHGHSRRQRCEPRFRRQHLAAARQGVDGDHEGDARDPLLRHDAGRHGQAGCRSEGEARDVQRLRPKGRRLEGAVRRPVRDQEPSCSVRRQGPGRE